jgi:hypothetical protein
MLKWMKEEADAAIDRQQRMLIFTNLIRLGQQINADPRRGGSRVGMANKDRHRFADAMLLDSDYFVDDATHTAKGFW